MTAQSQRLLNTSPDTPAEASVAAPLQFSETTKDRYDDDVDNDDDKGSRTSKHTSVDRNRQRQLSTSGNELGGETMITVEGFIYLA